jgi:hypothetical protein
MKNALACYNAGIVVSSDGNTCDFSSVFTVYSTEQEMELILDSNEVSNKVHVLGMEI